MLQTQVFVAMNIFFLLCWKLLPKLIWRCGEDGGKLLLIKVLDCRLINVWFFEEEYKTD